MHFVPEVHLSELNALYPRFMQVTGPQRWNKRFQSFHQQIKENPFIARYFDIHFPLEREMERLRQRRRLNFTFREPRTEAQVALYAFIASVSRIHPKLTERGKRRLAGMLRDALQAEYGLAPLRHELEVAAHLMTRNYDVRFCDMEESERFDLLAISSTQEIEVECKTVTWDAGRQIHRRKFYRLAGLIHPIMARALKSCSRGHIVNITIPHRLSNSSHIQTAIRDQVETALIQQKDIFDSEICTVLTHSFQIDKSPFYVRDPNQISLEDARFFVEGIINEKNINFSVAFRPDYGVLILAVTCTRSDNFLNALFRNLRQSAYQLSGKRPGYILIQLTDLEDAQLSRLASDETLGISNNLKELTARFFEKENNNHIHTVAWIADGSPKAVRKNYEGKWRRATQSNGLSYFFRNPNNPLKNVEQLSLF